MKLERLNELKQKGVSGDATINDLMEVLCEMYLTISKHSKGLNSQISEVSRQIQALDSRVETIENNTQSVLYTHIQEDDVLDEDEDLEQEKD